MESLVLTFRCLDSLYSVRLFLNECQAQFVERDIPFVEGHQFQTFSKDPELLNNDRLHRVVEHHTRLMHNENIQVNLAGFAKGFRAYACLYLGEVALPLRTTTIYSL